MELLLHQVKTKKPVWRPLSVGRLLILSVADPVVSLCVTPRAFSGTLPKYAVTAETNGELNQFLQWYSTSGVHPNITVLGMEGLRKGQAGQKKVVIQNEKGQEVMLDQNNW